MGRKYEEGLPPLIHQYDEQDEQLEPEKPTTVKIEFEIPTNVLEELKLIAKQEHRSTSSSNLKSEIVRCIELKIRVAKLLRPHGTIIVRRLPDGSEERIFFVI